MIKELLDQYEASGDVAARYRARVDRLLALSGHRVFRAPSKEGLLKILQENYSASSRVNYRQAWEHFIVWLRVTHALSWPSLKEASAVQPMNWEDVALLYLGIGKPEWSVFALLYQRSFAWNAGGVSYGGQSLDEPTKAALLRLISWGQGSTWIFPKEPGSQEVMAPDVLRKGLVSWRDAAKTAESAPQAG